MIPKVKTQSMSPNMKARYLFIFIIVLLSAIVVQAQTPFNLRIERVVPAAANVDMPDEDGDFPSYIELRAVETSIVTGVHLTDNPNLRDKWQVRKDLDLASGQSVIIFASGKDRPDGEELHTNFIYPCNVPFCGLYDDRLQQLDTARDLTDHCACDGLTLIRQGSKAEYLIPQRELDSTWHLPGFTPNPEDSWMTGGTGVGYDAAENPLCDGLILYATMDTADISGVTVKDVSGVTIHDGTITGGTSLPNETAKVNEGLRFLCDATPFVDFGAHPELDPGRGKDFSAAIWVRALSSQPAFQVIVSNGGLEQPGWTLFKDTTGTVAVFPRTVVRLVSVSGQAYTLPLPGLPLEEWHHIAFVVRSSVESPTLQGFFDGEPVGSPLPLDPGEDFSSSSNLLLGRDMLADAEFCGGADDFALWGRALTSEEVKDIHTAGNRGLSFKDPAAGLGDNLYDPLIASDVETEMRGKNTSAFVRVPFHLSAFPTSADKMFLNMRYDDGFVAYLNGVPVASRRAPSSVSWDSAATSDRFDLLGLAPEMIDISSNIGALQQGANVLAIHGLNASVDADRFLVLPELCLEFRPSRDPDDNCIKTTNGTEFWLAFPENFEEEPGFPPQPSIRIMGPPGTTGTVELPGLSLDGFPRSFSIPTGGDVLACVVIELPKEVELEGADDIEDKAVLVRADNEITVYGQNRIDYSTDSYLGLPLSTLGTHYRVLTYKNVQSQAPLIQGTQLAVVAPYDNTEVTITPKETVGGHAAGTPFTITLNRGQTYQLRNSADAPVDVTGIKITANKPVSVYGSHRCANIRSATQFFCDFIVEQLFPLEIWGNRYLVAPLETRSGDTLRILAAVDKTAVAIDEAGAVTNIILDEGEVHEMILTEPTTVTSNKPVLVAQFSNSWDFDEVPGNLADPFMVLIQPSDQWRMDYHISTPPKGEIDKSYITVIAPDSNVYAATRIVGNGFAPMALGTATGTFNTGEVYRRIELPASDDDCYRVYSTRGPIGLTVYGFDVFDSYGYPGGLCIPDKEPPLFSHPGQITTVTTTTAAVPDVLSLTHFADNVTSSGEITFSQSPPPDTMLTPGTYAITIQAIDGSGNVGQSQVMFVIDGPNSPPTFLGLSPQSVPVNSLKDPIDLTVGFDDPEVGGEGLSYEIVDISGDTEILESWAVDNETKELVLECRLNLLGTVDITLLATDPGGLSVGGNQLFSVTGTAYQEWLNANFPSDELSDPDMQVENWGEQGDADHDDINTLGEAYHGGNPQLFDEGPLDTVTFDAMANEYVFSWKKGVPSNGVEADSHWSLNLVDWYESGQGPAGDARTITITPGPIEEDEQSFEARIPGSSGQRIFLRLSYRRADS